MLSAFAREDRLVMQPHGCTKTSICRACRCVSCVNSCSRTHRFTMLRCVAPVDHADERGMATDPTALRAAVCGRSQRKLAIRSVNWSPGQTTSKVSCASQARIEYSILISQACASSKPGLENKPPASLDFAQLSVLRSMQGHKDETGSVSAARNFSSRSISSSS